MAAVIHPFAEHIAYYVLFASPILTAIQTGMASIASILGYITFIDFMNNMGHCNFELIPKSLFSIFPPLKYLMYTPSYHSLHHTQFRTNYSLFMPIYDYIYGTVDFSTDSLYEASLARQEELPNVVHLTHLTTPDSIYHIRLGFAYLASKPHTSKWYLWLMWPVTFWTMMYFMQWQRESINSLIEEAILDAEEKGVEVLSLGLMNQGEELNMNGELYIRRHPNLKVKVVDGSSLAVAVVLNTIPKGTTQVLLTSTISKVASSLAFALCQRGIQVCTLYEDEYHKLKAMLGTQVASNLVLAKSYAAKTWLVGDGLSEEEQMKASKGTLFIPFSQFPPQKMRNDCFYHTTPAMVTPKYLQNVDSCENWLPRRVMSAWRIAGIVHGLEGWKVNECGDMVFDNHKIWEATLRHGFLPLQMSPK
ncbi:hypothetical protein TEA_025193 [Camellia sinensis var. sinensis]|uniref:Fatty acid hydroxylase domain-containing protein n=1 Tax=Camellia sinensis var. sinensis TaxID=542762 RepID=A0A4S4E3D2_CAMSN|nr:hypothetical protein TEA_025193 [Camellia sinensis var. sinensis]